MQYVGETSRPANVRWYEHLYKIRKNDRGQLLYSHFNCDDAHRNAALEERIRFQIIEKIKCDDLSPSDSVLIRKRRTERELYWIGRLRTVHPLGLNDKLSGFGLHGNATDPLFLDFNMYRIVNICTEARVIPSSNMTGRHYKKHRMRPSVNDFESFGRELLTLSGDDFARVETLVNSKSRKFLERFSISHVFGTLPSKIAYIVRSKINYSRKVLPSRKEKESFLWKVQFSHKIIGDINLGSILGSAAVAEKLPSGIRKRLNIRPWFSYGRTIGGKILNYNKQLRDCGSLSYADILGMSCDCEQSTFKNAVFGHVITGDLGIIQNRELRKLCSYGTKFRENPILNIDRIKAQLLREIGGLITGICRKFRLPRSALKNWGSFLRRALISKLMSCKGRLNYSGSVLSRNECKRELDTLQNRYVITVVDKAAGNFAFTCRKFYFLRLASELGLDNEDPGNETYGFIRDTEVEVINRSVSDLLRFRLIPDENEKKLALLYQTPKFHKNPPKMRFIAGNVSTVTAKLDRIVALVLKMCKEHFRNLCTKCTGFSGIRYFFDVQTSVEVKAMFDSAAGSAGSISINDFSTLYTLFEHDHLLSNMTWLLGKLSKNSGMQYVRIGHDKAWWVRNDSEGQVYTVGELIDMIDYIVRNTYVKAFGSIFRQNKGIIMGGKSSGWLSIVL